LQRGLAILSALGTEEALAGGGLGVVRIADERISAPKYRLGAKLERTGRHVLAAAESLSSTLGNHSTLEAATP
jgi:hypothetical protein